MSINNWPTSERPRERLQSQGAAALSNTELLAILLGSGTKGCSVMDLSRQLLNHFGGVSGLLSAEREQLLAIKGLGAAKVASLAAIQELSKRTKRETLREATPLTSSSAAREYLCAELGHARREIFWALFLNTQHQVIASEALAKGTLDSASVYPREVLKACLRHNAAAVIFAHNHPSGSLVASEADKAITRRLQNALELVDIRVLDHIIIAGNSSLSMAETGLLH